GSTVIVNTSGTSGKHYVSKDLGANWTEITELGTQSQSRSIVSKNGQYALLSSAAADYPWMSTDGGLTWSQMTNAPSAQIYSAMRISDDGQKIILASSSGTV